MQKVMVIPDSFKGSLSSGAAADILAEAAKRHLKCEVVKLPIADGGEGSVDCILRACGGEKRRVVVHSPENLPIEAEFGIMDNKTAVIEIAESSGLTKQSGFHALTAGTYGFGELILSALKLGCQSFFLCLGGSATTDCGCGMAAALGVRFLDQAGNAFIPVGGTLHKVSRIDLSGLDPRISRSDFTVMSDVANPLYGPMGAASVYAPQKGASPQEVALLDAGLRHIARIIERDCHKSCRMEAAGAAGGAGYGCAAFLNASVVSGIEGLLSLCSFDSLVSGCDLILTGEGCLDDQSLMGKVLSGILRHAEGKEIVSFCGSCKASPDMLAKKRVTAVEIGRGIDPKESMENGAHYLRLAADAYLHHRSMQL